MRSIYMPADEETANKIKACRASDKKEDKIWLGWNGTERDLDDLWQNPKWSKLKEIREYVAMRGRDEDLDVLVSDPDKDVRKQVVNAGREQDMDKLGSDPDKDVRIAVVHEARTFGGVGAKKNKYFDQLVNDPEEDVREAVAYRSGGVSKAPGERYFSNPYLDKLVNDPSAKVRRQVVLHQQDKYLDALVDDPDKGVRELVAEYGKPRHLNKLVNDPEPDVREEVAKRGRDRNLEKLVNDPDKEVRETARKKVRELDLENLTQMQKTGKISKQTDLEEIAEQMPAWRESGEVEDKKNLPNTAGITILINWRRIKTGKYGMLLPAGDGTKIWIN